MEKARQPIRWSDGTLAGLQKRYELAPHGSSSLWKSLLLAQLKAANGLYDEADQVLEGLLFITKLESWQEDVKLNSELFFTLFLAQRFDLFVKLLQDFGDLSCELEICVEAGRANFWAVELRVPTKYKVCLVVDELVYGSEHSIWIGRRFVSVLPLFLAYIKDHSNEMGSIIISLGDEDLPGAVGFCTRRSKGFLIPDSDFISSRGYEALRREYERQDIPWHHRRPTAVWRGSSTGDPTLPPDRWRDLPRMRLCQIGQSAQASGMLDVGVTDIVQIDSDLYNNEIRSSGYLAAHIPPPDFQNWRYQIDIDGNTNSWAGLFGKLLSGSVVLKVESPGAYYQWYYNRLKPWVNFIPVSRDLGDLLDRIAWLRAHDDVARDIGRNGRLLANSLSYVEALNCGVTTMTAIMRSNNSGIVSLGVGEVTPREVELAYRLFLGRSPEDQSTVDRLAASARNLDELRQIFIYSDEFQQVLLATLNLKSI